jgi:hypothetical protein
MKTGYRPGSAGDQQEKSEMKAKLVMGAVTLLLFAMCYLNLFHTELFQHHLQASWGAKIFGVVVFAAAFLPLVFENWLSDQTESDWLWFVLWIIFFVLSIFVSSGFNFGS